MLNAHPSGPCVLIAFIKATEYGVQNDVRFVKFAASLPAIVHVTETSSLALLGAANYTAIKVQ